MTATRRRWPLIVIGAAAGTSTWLVGNTERVKDALRAQKQPGLRVVAGGQ